MIVPARQLCVLMASLHVPMLAGPGYCDKAARPGVNLSWPRHQFWHVALLSRPAQECNALVHSSMQPSCLLDAVESIDIAIQGQACSQHCGFPLHKRLLPRFDC